MSFYNPQMTTAHIGNATRPWQSLDALENPNLDAHGYVAKKQPNQREIEMCLNCPFPSCEGTARKCRSYRAHYVSKRRRQ